MDGSHESSSTDSVGLVETLLAGCLGHEPAERAATLARLCAENPTVAVELRALYERLAQVGLAQLPLDMAAEFPERLGDFRLLERLGRGGMGIVYLAEQESFGRKVALKLIQPAQLYFPGARARFRREAHAVAALKHHGIVPVFAFGEEHGIPYLAMEFVDGLTLAQVLEALRARRPETLTAAAMRGVLQAEEQPMFEGTWPQACLRVTARIADALAHAHAHGLVHRDVKPSNVMLTGDGRVMLLDFGLAHADGAAEFTRSGSQPGSLPYMAPEQARGEGADARSDVYSLGVTLYEMLTLQLPFLQENSEATRLAILGGAHTAVRTRNRAVSRDAETVCHKAIELRPADRYATAAALSDDLHNVLELRPIRARPPAPLARLGKWAQRHPGVATLACLLAATVSGAISWLLWQSRRLEAAHLEAATQAERRQEAVDRLLRLSDTLRLQLLNAHLLSLGPTHPDNEEPYVQWIGEAELLMGRLPVHEATLAALRATGRQLPAPATSPAASEDNGTPRTSGQLAGKAPEPAPQWTLGSLEQQWEHDQLAGLVAGLCALDQEDTGQLPLMRARLAFAREVRRLTIDEQAAAWQRVNTELAADPRFAGLVLRPQLGLVPLGEAPGSRLQEFLHLQTHAGPRPEWGRLGRLRVDCETGILLVLVPGGTFWMGTQRSNPNGHNYDRDACRDPGLEQVTIDPFFIGKHEVTRGQWWRACRENPSGRVARENEVLPVEGVRWLDAQRTLTELNLCLPTEAQWESACRAGTETPWSTGPMPASLRDYANLMGIECEPRYMLVEAWNDGFVGSAPVGTFRANAFGLYDMHGNVDEWCRDDAVDYTKAPARTGDGLRCVGSNPSRIERGGSYFSKAEMATSAVRVGQPASERILRIGCRAARAIDR